jgi:hypothetical protein
VSLSRRRRWRFIGASLRCHGDPRGRRRRRAEREGRGWASLRRADLGQQRPRQWANAADSWPVACVHGASRVDGDNGPVLNVWDALGRQRGRHGPWAMGHGLVRFGRAEACWEAANHGTPKCHCTPPALLHVAACQTHRPPVIVSCLSGAIDVPRPRVRWRLPSRRRRYCPRFPVHGPAVIIVNATDHHQDTLGISSQDPSPPVFDSQPSSMQSVLPCRASQQ